jgi:glycosyltransferase involved in cell wall biosynthesis
MIFVNARFLTQPLSGVQRYAFEISMQMKKLNPEIVFLTPSNVLHLEWEKSLGAKRIGKLKGHIWEQFELVWYLKRQNKPKLFSPANTGPINYPNQYLTLHDISFKVFPQFNTKKFVTYYNFVIPKLLNKVKSIFTVSQTVKSEISKTYTIPESKIIVTYNGIGETLSNISNQNIQFHKEKILLSVGSLSSRKNTQLIIDSFLASELAPHYRLVLIGNTNSIFTSLKLKSYPNIEIIEKASDSLILEYYQKAELACYLSNYEGFGLPILESLYFNCKVLCSDIPVFKELFSTYVSFCTITSINEVVAQLNLLPLKSTVTPLQIESLKQKYSYKTSANQILQIISAV